MTIIVSTRQLLDIEDFFGTSANCTVGIYTFIVKKIQKWKLDNDF